MTQAMYLTLYDKGGSNKGCQIHKFDYNGTFMGECFVTAKIESERPIVFEIGDYLVFRDEQFVLNYIPPKAKKAKQNTHGSAFVYENIKFNSLADELTRVEFLDVVPSDNQVHYSSISDFSFYANSVKDLAERLQANLDRVYTGAQRWEVVVSVEAMTSDKHITISKINCWDALTLASSEFGANFIVRNRKIIIGTAGIAVGKVFGYGKGKGLYDIQQTANEDALIVTRLRAYGNTRNLPNRYYNKLKNASGIAYIKDSVYIPHLMLPEFPYTIQDPAKVYIESDKMALYGLREGSVYFDGNEDRPDVYPSLEGMTKKQLNDAGITVSLKSGDNGAIDECLGAINPTDNGEIPEDGQGEIPAEFTIYIKDLGFDLSAKDGDGQYKYATSDTMQLSMKSGMCIGRTFDILERGIEKDTSLGYVRYKVTCKRFTDDSIAGGTAFPNSKYGVGAGDKFVILGIDMPDVYVKAAAQRLKVVAKDYLALHDETKYTYSPKVDEIFMANNPQLGKVIKEGDIFNFEDTDLDIDASVIIQTLKISIGDKLIPTYEITLSNERIAGTLEKMQNAISQLASNNTGVTIEQVKSLIMSLGTHHFLSRLQNDTAEGVIAFMKNVSVEQDLTVHKDVVIKRNAIADQFGNSTFTSGQFGSGFRMWRNAQNGQSYAEFDNLLVRRNMDVSVLTINEIQSVGGQILVTLARQACSKVEIASDGYKCYFEHDGGTIPNQFAVNDQVICRRFDSKRTVYYWRRILSLGANYIHLSKTDVDGSGVPAIGDEMIQFGNRINTARQSAILISAYGSDSPSIKQYSGINSYDLTGKEVTVISPMGNKFTGTFSVKSGNNQIRVPADRGTWTSGMVCYYYDRVSYNGALWLCIVQEGQSSTQTPIATSQHWQKQVAEGQKGDSGLKGDKGDKGIQGDKGLQGNNGAQGERGLQGVAGAKGADGQTTYTWIRYADTIAGGGISNLPTNKLFIGLAYNKTTATESNVPADYKWSLIKGDKGDTGVAGIKGADGQTTYTWIKYADVADGTGLYDVPKASTKYIGIAVNKTVAAESVNKLDYTWSLFKGADGTNGTNGKDGRDGINGTNGVSGSSSFFHVRYSANANGNPMTTASAKYIGTAVTQSQLAPTSYTAYTWFDWKGAQGDKGQQGIAGTNGANGQTSYLHIKYSNDGGKTLTGNNGEDVGDWLGQYADFVLADSNDVTKYQWAKIKGHAGDLIYIRGTNWNKDTSPRVEVNGATISTPTARGLTLTVLKRSDLSLVFKQSYDVYTVDEAIGNNLAEKIKTYSSEYFIILNSKDAIKLNVNLIHAMVSVGAVGQSFEGRFSYALIGYKGLAKGTALEVCVSNANEPYFAEIATNVIRGQFVGTGTNVEVIQSVVDTSFQILDNKIASKVSQTDFSSLSGRVTTAESKITQQAGQITSTIQKVDGKNTVYKSYTNVTTDRPPIPYAKNDIWISFDGIIKQSKNTRLTGAFVDGDWVVTTKYTDDTAVKNLQIGGTNLVANSKSKITITADTTATNEKVIWSGLTTNLIGGETYTFSCKTDGVWGNAGNTVEAFVMKDKSASAGQYVNMSTNPCTFKAPLTGTYHIRLDINHRHYAHSFWEIKIEKGDKATDWSPAPADFDAEILIAKTAADKAQTSANTAQTAANTAQTMANTANTKLAEIANDNLLIPSEKQETLKEWQIIQGERATIINQAKTYGIATTAYETAYNNLNTYITPLLANLTVNTAIVGNDFRARFKGYYDAKVALLKLVTDAAKVLADKAQTAANTAQTGANNAQATADSKIRTFYSDTTPATPTGGFKVGDLWYKISLTDGCYLTYRWNGSAWQQINVYVSKSRIEQTDSRITSVVEKTGINSLGNGETLFSKINQTDQKISLEVGKIKVGGRNLFLNSNFIAGFNHWNSNGNITRVIENDGIFGKVAKIVTTVSNNGIYQNPSPRRTSGKTYVISGYMKSATAMKVRIAHEGGVGTVDCNVTTAWQYFETMGVWNSGGSVCFYAAVVGTFYLANLQYEEGNKSTGWSPAPEDIGNIAGASLTLTNNNITLGANTISLDGTTIAKSIEAGDLKVGSRTGLSALEVLRNGTFYAKGSYGESSLELDSQNQKILLKSPYAYYNSNGNGGSSSTHTSTSIEMSASKGGLEAKSGSNVASVSPNGLFANNAGMNPYPASLGVSNRASVIGLGYGSLSSDYGYENFIAGVYGSASNSISKTRGGASAYGGYFQNLRANGLVLGTRIIEGNSSTSYLYQEDSLVISLSNYLQTVYLPSNLNRGTVIWLKQWASGYMRVRPRSPNVLYDDSTRNDSLDIGEGWMAMCVFVDNIKINNVTSSAWLFSRFKF